ncbi:hypothetical protein KC351_g8277 [Hortaea werneckii]|nr:hypothetical protein KC351_g8277 [Hortaea werneckii]
MSTIASPRPSISLSSRRTSTSTDNTTRSTSTSRPAGPGAGNVRRNRAALRDYYGLKEAAPADARDTQAVDTENESELDKADFDPEAYVHSLLASDGLEGVLRIETGLVGDIRSLDGEKKALVYDNYSKLIAATDTIRSMREKMDPLTQTSTLTNDIGRIAERAANLSGQLRNQETDPSRTSQQQTVRWVLDTPNRLRRLVQDNKRDAAEAEWNELSALLDKWQPAKGTANVRAACLEALGKDIGG